MRFYRWMLVTLPLAFVACSGSGATPGSGGGSSTGAGSEVGGSPTGASTGGVGGSSAETSTGTTGNGGAPGTTVTALVAGLYETCAAMSTGAVVCWGANAGAPVGTGTQMDALTPVPVTGVQVASLPGGRAPISLSWGTVCSVTSAGGAVCWGAGTKGQLGNNTKKDWNAPVAVLGLSSGVQAIGAGFEHACAATSSGVKCWGSNEYAQLGDGYMELSSLAPVSVLGLSSGALVVSTAFRHTCALTGDGGVKCWGANAAGQLGNDGANNVESAPVDVLGLSSGVGSISSGDVHTCALTTGGAVKCWGNNDRGQLGDGTLNQAYSPVDVVGLSSGVQVIAAGSARTCAIKQNGTVVCWGLGTILVQGMPQILVPTAIPGLSNAVAIAVGHDHACAATSAGVKCWGSNSHGELGDGTTTATNTPVEVIGLP
jgi:alpha-tubulin suppressor-like RCC1 family protein